MEFQKFLIYLIQAIIKKLIKIQKKSENTNFTKPKKQSKLDILDFESSNNETLSMSTKRQILSSIKSSVYKFFLSLFASKANKNISNNYDITKDQFTIFTKQNILLAFTNLKSTKQLQKSLAWISKEINGNIIYEMSGWFKLAIKDKNDNYLCSGIIKFVIKFKEYKFSKN